MALRKSTDSKGRVIYDATSITSFLDQPVAVEIMLDQCDKITPVNDVWLTVLDIIKFIRYLTKNVESGKDIDTLQRMLSFIQGIEKKKRVNSRRLRWHVAYRQAYKCQLCKELLFPTSFDIDHIVPLSTEGGEDTLSNMRALCCNCHSRVTRGDH